MVEKFCPSEAVVKSEFDYPISTTGLHHNIEGVFLGREGIGPTAKTISSLYNAARFSDIPLYLIKEFAPKFRYDSHIPLHQLPKIMAYQDFQNNLDRNLRDVILADSILSEVDVTKPFSIQTAIHSGRGVYMAILERSYPLDEGMYSFIANPPLGKLIIGAKPLDHHFRHIVKDVGHFNTDIDTNIDNETIV